MRGEDGHLLLPHLREGRRRPEPGVDGLAGDAKAGSVVMLFMGREGRAGLACVGTLVATVRRLASMNPHVSGEAVLRLEFLSAQLAIIGHLALTVDLGHVLAKSWLWKPYVANLAQILIIGGVGLDIMPCKT